MPAVPPGGLPPESAWTLVAFGNMVAAGATAPIGPIAGGASLFTWGAWGAPVFVVVESSVDRGASWAVCQVMPLHPSGSAAYARRYALDGAPPAGPALYRLRLASDYAGPGVPNVDAPPERLDGVTLEWAIYQ